MYSRLFLFCCWLVMMGKTVSAQDALLWRVSSPESKSSGWLMGTIHTYPEDVLQMDSTVLELLASSKGLVLETELSWKMLIGALFAPGEMLDAGSDAELTQDLRQSCYAFFVEGKWLSEQEFKLAIRPGIAQTIQALCLAVYGTTQDAAGMEGHLKTAAAQLGLSTAGLDTDYKLLNQWYAHYGAINDAAWQASNTDSLVSAAFYALGNTYSAYGIQDTAVLFASGNADLYQNGLSLVAWRNLRWMKQLPEFFKEGKFVAVGAAHLFGEHGVVTLLRSQGFQVTPVTTDFRGQKFWRFMQRYSSLYELQ